jgi:hypothetical protein
LRWPLRLSSASTMHPSSLTMASTASLKRSMSLLERAAPPAAPAAAAVFLVNRAMVTRGALPARRKVTMLSAQAS